MPNPTLDAARAYLAAPDLEPELRTELEPFVAAAGAGDAAALAELEDRFFEPLAFGTGGLRGKTIGAIVTKAERGSPQALGRPEFSCVGTNAMNTYNISRATGVAR